MKLNISPKILIFEILYFCPNNFFFKKVNSKSLREFYWLLKSKSRKKNFKQFWRVIDFRKVLKKAEKSSISRTIEFHGPEIRLDRKRIKVREKKKK